jgi:hypothetical protein
MKHTLSDETLYAYVDNELDAAASAQVEAAMAADPVLARRVEEQRAVRALLGAAYEPVLSEPVPARLVSAAHKGKASQESGKVFTLASARESRRKSDMPGAWTWQHWGGMAACLVIGVFAGRSAWLAGADEITAQNGHLVARGPLAKALSTQLASAQAVDAPVKIGLSYVSRDNAYCRSFTMPREGTGGLACLEGGFWKLRVVAQDTTAAAGSDLRMAASPVPAAVLKVVDEQISGSPLDADGERAAMQEGWRR